MLHVKMIRGLSTGWLQQGSTDTQAPIALFLHGFPDTPENWHSQMEEFSKDFLVVAPYLRGCGPSESTTEKARYSLDSIALDQLAILRDVDPSGKRPVIVFGHDIGATHAWHLARLLHHRLRSLVIINGPALEQMARRISNPHQLLRSWYIGFFQLPKVPEQLLLESSPQLIEYIYRKGGLGEKSPLPAQATSPKDISGMINQYRQALREGLSAWFRRPKPVEAPVLILWGKKDPFLITPNTRELRRLARSFTIRVLDGGHWIHQEQSERVNRLIRHFIGQQPCSLITA